MEADLVDADRFRTVVTPEVGVHIEPGWLPFSQQQLLGEGPRHGRLADPLFTDQAKSMRKPAGRLLRPKDADGPLMASDCSKSTNGRGRCSTCTGGWHCLATLTSLSLTPVSRHSYAGGVSAK